MLCLIQSAKYENCPICCYVTYWGLMGKFYYYQLYLVDTYCWFTSDYATEIKIPPGSSREGGVSSGAAVQFKSFFSAAGMFLLLRLREEYLEWNRPYSKCTGCVATVHMLQDHREMFCPCFRFEKKCPFQSSKTSAERNLFQLASDQSLKADVA